MWANVAGLPVGVVGGMSEEFVPFGRAAFEEELFRIGERPHAEKKLVAVGRSEVEGLGRFMQRVFEFLSEGVKEREILGEEKCAVVVEIVAHEPIRDWRLG